MIQVAVFLFLFMNFIQKGKNFPLTKQIKSLSLDAASGEDVKCYTSLRAITNWSIIKGRKFSFFSHEKIFSFKSFSGKL
jgi:hypothetical protein